MLGQVKKKKPSKHLIDYLLGQNIPVSEDVFSGKDSNKEADFDLDKYVEATSAPKKEVKKEPEKVVDPIVAKMDSLLKPDKKEVEEDK